MNYYLDTINLPSSEKEELIAKFNKIYKAFVSNSLFLHLDNEMISLELKKIKNSIILSLISLKKKFLSLREEHPKFGYTYEYSKISNIFEQLEKIENKFGKQKSRILSEFKKLKENEYNRFPSLSDREIESIIDSDIKSFNLAQMEKINYDVYFVKVAANFVVNSAGLTSEKVISPEKLSIRNKAILNWCIKKFFSFYCFDHFELSPEIGETKIKRILGNREYFSKKMGLKPGELCYISISLEKTRDRKIKERGTFRFPEKKEGILYLAKSEMMEAEDLVEVTISPCGKKIKIPVFMEYLRLAHLPV